MIRLHHSFSRCFKAISGHTHSLIHGADPLSAAQYLLSVSVSDVASIADSEAVAVHAELLATAAEAFRSAGLAQRPDPAPLALVHALLARVLCAVSTHDAASVHQSLRRALCAGACAPRALLVSFVDFALREPMDSVTDSERTRALHAASFLTATALSLFAEQTELQQSHSPQQQQQQQPRGVVGLGREYWVVVCERLLKAVAVTAVDRLAGIARNAVDYDVASLASGALAALAVLVEAALPVFPPAILLQYIQTPLEGGASPAHAAFVMHVARAVANAAMRDTTEYTQTQPTQPTAAVLALDKVAALVMTAAERDIVTLSQVSVHSDSAMQLLQWLCSCVLSRSFVSLAALSTVSVCMSALSSVSELICQRVNDSSRPLHACVPVVARLLCAVISSLGELQNDPNMWWRAVMSFNRTPADLCTYVCRLLRAVTVVLQADELACAAELVYAAHWGQLLLNNTGTGFADAAVAVARSLCTRLLPSCTTSSHASVIATVMALLVALLQRMSSSTTDTPTQAIPRSPMSPITSPMFGATPVLSPLQRPSSPFFMPSPHRAAMFPLSLDSPSTAASTAAAAGAGGGSVTGSRDRVRFASAAVLPDVSVTSVASAGGSGAGESSPLLRTVALLSYLCASANEQSCDCVQSVVTSVLLAARGQYGITCLSFALVKCLTLDMCLCYEDMRVVAVVAVCAGVAVHGSRRLRAVDQTRDFTGRRRNNRCDLHYRCAISFHCLLPGRLI